MASRFGGGVDGADESVLQLFELLKDILGGSFVDESTPSSPPTDSEKKNEKEKMKKR
jgi:hypothetical protein